MSNMSLFNIIILALIIGLALYKLVRYIFYKIELKRKENDEINAVKRVKDDLVVDPKNTFVVTNVFSRYLSKFKNVREIRVEYRYIVNNLVRDKVKVLYAYPSINRIRKFDYFDDFWITNKKKLKYLQKN